MRAQLELLSKVAEINLWHSTLILCQCFISCREDAEAADNGDGGGGGGGQTRQGPHSHAAQGGSRSGIPP